MLMQAAHAACFFAKINMVFFFCNISAYYRQQKTKKKGKETYGKHISKTGLL